MEPLSPGFLGEYGTWIREGEWRWASDDRNIHSFGISSHFGLQSVSLGAGFQLFRIYGEARYCTFRNDLKEKFLNRWNQDIRHRFLSKTVQFVGHGILITFQFSLFLFP